MSEKPKTMAELRHETFLHYSKLAKDLAEAALGEIDTELIENQRLLDNWLERGHSQIDPPLLPEENPPNNKAENDKA